MTETVNEKNITVNRKARHEFTILHSVEVGIVLVGTEVKSLRQGKINLTDSYATIKDGEVWLINSHINVYDHGNINNHDPLRKRKLLLNRSEIRKLEKSVNEKGNTLIPLRFYFKGGRVKVELGIVKGKKLYDKRQDIAKKDAERELDRKLKY
ncbi:MAG: SsrA-binding protein SmpB [Melioribacteraceae bacterium]|jgi:SsrA-binding protein|nr:SsrA-binding protein SmpB [Melioribacteraceae bacterium]WKZ71230.1 MAG: SsrA-binding protein SmpB [Melioribacteraceae bacterium]